jgi:hypothetical protein
MIDYHTLTNEYYVYWLAYPESMGGAIFYIGKGQGYRIADHEREARKGVQSRKCDIIRDIWMHGEEVVKGVIATFAYYREHDALMYEWAMINMTSFAEHLANQKSGTFNRRKTNRVIINGRAVFV